jgi:arylsulfatase A-like enzyme
VTPIPKFAGAALLIATALSGPIQAAPSTPTGQRPNIVVIVADDLGFSDLGAFGGEIRTPNLDALAKSGLRLTDFHAAPSCSPTRSMLLTGTDNHTAGVGAMAEVSAPPALGTSPAWGYEGALTTRVATLAERLSEAGYFTAMAGKWHLGLKREEDPHARGFQRSFALLQGAHNHFGGSFGPSNNPYMVASYTEDGRPARIPARSYSSDHFTTKLIEQLSDRPKEKPFFAYLAFTAPHSPLQALPEDMARYKGRYDAGWEMLRRERLARMIALGIVARDVSPAPVVPDAAAWDKLAPEQKKVEARKMEIYAAMVDRLDQNVGRLVAALKRSGAYENTVILFTSDNGPAAEGAELYGKMPGMAAYLRARDHSYRAMGSRDSSVFLGPYWAQAASAPDRLYKGFMTEGGTRVAAFVSYAKLPRRTAFGRAYASVMDVVPTLLEAASAPSKAIVSKRAVAPLRGRSMLSYWQGKRDTVHPPDEAITFELHGHRTVRQGRWKLLQLATEGRSGAWTLYDMFTDPAEQVDLSQRYPGRVRKLLDAWEAFASEVRIVGSTGDGH